MSAFISFGRESGNAQVPPAARNVRGSLHTGISHPLLIYYLENIHCRIDIDIKRGAPGVLENKINLVLLGPRRKVKIRPHARQREDNGS